MSSSLLWRRLFIRLRHPMRKVSILAIVLWALIFFDEAASRSPSLSSFLGILFLGGGVIYLLRQISRYLEQNHRRFQEDLCNEVLKIDPFLKGDSALTDITAFLLTPFEKDLARQSKGGYIKKAIKDLVRATIKEHEIVRRPQGLMMSLLEIVEYNKLLIIQNFQMPIQIKAELSKGESLELLKEDDELILLVIFSAVTFMICLVSLYGLIRKGAEIPGFESKGLIKFSKSWLTFCSLSLSEDRFPPKSLRGEEFSSRMHFDSVFIEMLKNLCWYLKFDDKETLGLFIKGFMKRGY